MRDYTGQFYKTRIKSQALLDLSPIRPAMAQTPEDSDYTAIQEKIKFKKSKVLNLGFNHNDIPFELGEYCA
jgi:hypothetical protein